MSIVSLPFNVISAFVVIWSFSAAVRADAPSTQPTAPQWGIFDVALNGPTSGNPFVDVQFSAKFTCGDQALNVPGFYDGDGTYRIHFMPTAQGQWSFVTQSNADQLNGKTGSFTCVAPVAGNHGPVRVHNTWHFAYADGTPFVCMGTTAYSWVHEPDEKEDQTLQTLRNSPFDKVRMCVQPGKADPVYYPYVKDDSGKWDQMRFNPDFFRHLEKRIEQLGEQGVEADLILFHPYGKGQMQWFDQMDNAGDDRYLHYVVARLSAYHNVWWSLANEYTLVRGKSEADWDHFFQLVAADDPYGHLRSIHNNAKFYDSNKPWVTHATIQNGLGVADFGRAVIPRELWRKPIVYDEVCYEGDIPSRWGKLTPQELVKRFWMGTIGGTYVGHGETYANGWTNAGGELKGQSPARLAFLRKILEAGPPGGIDPIDEYYQDHIGGRAGEFYLVYFGEEKPTQWTFAIPRNPPARNALAAGMKFHVDILDTWNMTITPVDQVFTVAKFDSTTSVFPAEGNPKVDLPGQPYIALRITRNSETGSQ